MISVCIIEDDPDIRSALFYLINGSDGFSCISGFESCEQALSEIVAEPPDVVLMDLHLPGMSGIQGIKKMRDILPTVSILVLTVCQHDSVVFEALCAGAKGYLTKKADPAKILQAIREMLEGGSPMSPQIARLVVESFQAEPQNVGLSNREEQVLRLLCKGNSYKMIASTLSISRHTVNSHLKSIYQKLDVHSEAQAVSKAIMQRLI